MKLKAKIIARSWDEVPAELTIGDVADLLGVPEKQARRFLERCGLLTISKNRLIAAIEKEIEGEVYGKAKTGW